MSCYHGVYAGHQKGCIRPEPIHIKPRGSVRVTCDSPSRTRERFPAFVDQLMGATCKRCRERYAMRLAREAKLNGI